MDQRNTLQHRVLSLPVIDHPTAQDEPPVSSSMQHAMYECCRLAAILYSLAVVFPMPLGQPIRAQLTMRMATIMQQLPLHVVYDAAPAGVLWMLVMGGMSAFGVDDVRARFVHMTAQLCLKDGRGPRTWEEVRNVMDLMLWLDYTCASAGKCFWEEVLSDNKGLPILDKYYTAASSSSSESPSPMFTSLAASWEAEDPATVPGAEDPAAVPGAEDPAAVPGAEDQRPF